MGARYVTDECGRQLVLTWWPGAEARQRTTKVPRVLDCVHAAGYPAPGYFAVVDVVDGIAVLQERIVGDRVESVSLTLSERLFELNGMRRDLFDAPGGSFDDLFFIVAVRGSAYGRQPAR